MYNFAYWLHIISCVLWLFAFVSSIWYGFKIRFEKDAIAKRSLMRSERLATGIGAHLGALGILISGIVMTAGPQWAWFNVQLYPWLTLKQILFIVILILIVFSVRRSIVFKNKLQQEKVPESDTPELWGAAYRMSMTVYVLVVINSIMGLTKPLLSF